MFCDAIQFVAAMGLVAGVICGSAIAFMRLYYIKLKFLKETNERITSKVITLVSVIILTTLVYLQCTECASGLQKCVGTIISEFYVMTAALCFFEVGSSSLPTDWEIITRSQPMNTRVDFQHKHFELLYKQD